MEVQNHVSCVLFYLTTSTFIENNRERVMSAADISRKEKYSRCVALEEDYVHQVYESIGKELAQAKDPMQDTVRQFLDELEPGSLVADIGKLGIYFHFIVNVFFVMNRLFIHTN